MNQEPWVKLQTELVPVVSNLPALGQHVLRTKVVPPPDGIPQDPFIARLWRYAGLLAAPLMAYHGFHRTGSAGWTVAWTAFGALAPFLAIPVAFTQGFAEPKKK